MAAAPNDLTPVLLTHGDVLVPAGLNTVGTPGSYTVSSFTTQTTSLVDVSSGAVSIQVSGSLSNAGIIRETGFQSLTLSATSLTNTGTIIGQSTGLLEISNSTITNTGFISETGFVGTLRLTGDKVSNVNPTPSGSAGTLYVSGTNSSIILSGSTIIGGTLTAVSGGAFLVQGTTASVISGVEAAVTLNGPLWVQPTAAGLRLGGSIINKGTINVGASTLSAGNDGSNNLAPQLTLSGGGSLALTKTSVVNAAGVSTTLENVDNTISGSGSITLGAVVNDAAGVINANQADALSISATQLTNAGNIRLSGAGGLSLTGGLLTNSGTIANTANSTLSLTAASLINSGAIIGQSTGLVSISNSTITNTGFISETGFVGTLRLTNDKVINVNPTPSGSAGTLYVSGANSSIILSGSTIIGGTLKAVSGGAFLVQGTTASVISGVEAAVTLNGPLWVQPTAAGLRLGGSIINKGTITVGPSTLWAGNDGSNNLAPQLTLSGGGSLSLAKTTVINTLGVITTLENVDNTISGSGSIGLGAVVNDAAGVIDANQVDALTIVAGSLSNAGTVRSSGAGGLTYRGGPLTNSGTIANTGIGALSLTTSLINNSGTIIGQSTGSLAITNSTITNTGTLSETGAGGGVLRLTNDRVVNVNPTPSGPAGTLYVSGVNARVILDGSTIIGGTLTAAAGGAFLVQGSIASVISGVEAAVTLNGPLWVQPTAAGLRLGGSIINKGTIDIGASTLWAGNDGSNRLAPQLTLSGGGSLSLAKTTVTNTLGVITTLENVDNTISGSGSIGLGAVVNDAAGVIDANQSDALSIVAGSFSNAGTIRSSGTGGLTYRGGLLTNSGTIANTGIGALSLSASLTNSGTITSSGTGPLSISADTLSNTGSLTANGHGTLTLSATTLTNNGVILANGGTVVSNVFVGGTGTIQVQDNGLVDLKAGSSDAVQFAGNGSYGRLQLDTNTSYSGVITGFAGASSIDLRGLAFSATASSVRYSAGVLTVSEGGSSVSLNFAGSYTADSFRVASDGNGGTLISSISGLFGTAGNNTLRSSATLTTLVGGAGNDTYYVNQSGVTVVELANEGTDTVISSVDFTLSANLERLTLAAAGISGTGNAANNTLSDFTGGGAGNRMAGGLGNDTYIVTNSADVIVENANEGTDTVKSSVSYTLSANVENLALTAAGISGTGNASNNTLWDFKGGSAGNQMSGGLGNDTYVVTNSADVIIENANEGTDTIRSSVSYALSANVENLVLTAAGISGTGNAANNTLWDFAGGGAGNQMSGGLGNDTYVVTNSADVIVENANEGTDTIRSSVSYTLAANVENLTLTGTGDLNGSGNAGANVIRANSGNDVLDGKGGNDTLYGGAGQNTFLYNRGYGSNTIVNTGFGADADVLEFGSTVADDQLWFRHVGNDLKISVIGTSDSVTVRGWYTAVDGSNQISTLKDGGGLTLDHSAVENLVQAMATLPPPPLGTTTLPPSYASVQTVIAANWH